ncbi:MAG: protein O-mannosyl-transferase family [Kiritimatiellia bacterium]
MSKEEMKNRFFGFWDWAAFGTATLVTLAIYVWTLGPSVGLEDSGELATAGAHLGVPHPPGYPFWTVCSWIFCKLFFWVTYMGHPTPAWAISFCSSVFGAFAAGFTAMLICRSARDFIGEDGFAPRTLSLLSFAGGVGGALTFALSPVEWSQSTIVEIYSLNAFFLMWVFLLSYRWMRQPSDLVLWTTAFVFGLGLTNYQVLFFAILPLALIIFMRDGAQVWEAALLLAAALLVIVFVSTHSFVLLALAVGIGLYTLHTIIRTGGMVRDVLVYLVPVLLTMQILQIGALPRADPTMSSGVLAKLLPVGVEKTAWIQRMCGVPGVEIRSVAEHCPYTGLVAFAVFGLIAALVAAIVLRERGRVELARKTMCYGGGGAVTLLVLSGTVFTHTVTWSGALEEPIAPLASPVVYTLIAAAVAGSVVAAALAVLHAEGGGSLFAGGRAHFIYAAIGFAVAAAVIAWAGVDQATIRDLSFHTVDGTMARYKGPAYPWFWSTSVFCGLLGLLFLLTSFTKRGLALAIPVAGLQTAAFILLHKGAMNGLTHPQSWWFTWPILWNLVVLALVWLTLPTGRSVAGAAFFTQLGIGFYVYMPIASDLRNPPMNWGYPRTWEGFKHAVQRGQYEAIGFPTFTSMLDFCNFLGRQMLHYFSDVRVQFTTGMGLLALVPFGLGHFVSARARRTAFWKWMLAAASCFIMMSFLLILLAAVKGDVQDGFIQKVKFIASHAMIALWIGYGLIFLVAGVCRLCRLPRTRRMVVGVCAPLLVLVSAAIPIAQNYGNDRLVFEMGGAEQNGHTFGWQFGAYQLEGAAAIRDQLVQDEEPLPDPGYPARMDDYAIFFGGTDPGRFVPTYMIYSARYRPDVYLITQNALADDTYMSVQRDLYGDEIWIPSKEDSGEAFNEYVNSMTPEERAAKGVVMENGRVQVTGALSVMDINAILTRKMFEHDRLRHAFYVEESYVIPWMYEYLSPHGLIMKINRDKTPYDPKTAARDRDFWDWYVRRLLNDPMYRRDFAGQKSFSKLRSAIAGLYAKQGRRLDALQAYREACLLYPASPESTFRYAQEVLLPHGRHDVILDLLDFTDRIDPHNQRTGRLREFVGSVSSLNQTVGALGEKHAKGTLTRAESFELAKAYYSLGRTQNAADVVRGLIEATAAPEELKFISMILLDSPHPQDAEKALVKYLKAVPNADVDAWVALAGIRARAQRAGEAMDCLRAALRINRDSAIQKIQQDAELVKLVGAAPTTKGS